MDVEVRSFEEDVIQASYAVPVVVDFWAGWCAPCRLLGPVLDKLAQEADGAWRLAKVDVDANPEVSQAHGISGIPAVKLFHEGKEIAEFVGALPEPQVAEWLEEHLPSESRKAVAEARAAIATGDFARARSMLEDIVGGDPANLDARTELAMLLFESDPKAAVDQVAEVEADHPEFDRVSGIRTLQRLGDLQDSGEREDSEDWMSYLDGIAAMREGRYSDALAAWIGMLERRARDVDDDGARKACIAVFHLLGEGHEVTQTHRRSFSSALY